MSNQVIFTKHATERMSLRSVSESDVRSVLNNPGRTQPAGKPETTKFIRTLRGRDLQVIARHLTAENKTLVISVWVRGEDDPVPLIWTLLAFPFKLSWWIMMQLFKALLKLRE
jgi:hypothetical protein